MISLGTLLAFPATGHAEIRVVTGAGEHRMTDRETKEDAIRLATEQAKKQALEQVASYLESVTVVRDLDVTQDEIRSYTAGMVLVLDQQVKTELDGEVIVVRVVLTAQVDTDEVAQAITALKRDEDARQELLALKQDVDQLQQELDAANQALATAASPEEAQQLNQQRTDLLNRVQSNAMVAQAWTDWVLVAPVMQPYPWAGLAQVQALLSLAGRLNPHNPHLAIAQQTIGAKSPPAPPQPPRPPIPHTVPFLPGFAAPQQPDQPGKTSPTPAPNSRQLSSVYQLNPLLPNPPGQPPLSEDSTTIIQVPAQPGTLLVPPGRSMLPMYRQVPAPNGQPAAPTLHTHQPRSDRGSPSGQQPPAQGPRQMRPSVAQQAPHAPFTGPPQPPQRIPNRGPNQDGR